MTLNKANLKEIVQFPFPFPEEQKRIVAILDKAFEGIATAKANAEQNLKNARAIFESELNAIFTHLQQNSELVTLSDLATDITDGDHLPATEITNRRSISITIGNIVKENRQIDFRQYFQGATPLFRCVEASQKARQGDVLYTVTGSFGIPVLIRSDVEFCFQRHIGLIRPNPETMSSWLYYLLLSPQVLRQATDGATGTAQKTVSLKLLRGFKVPKATPKQQQKAVATLDDLTTETQRLESIYQRKISELDALKKSLLNHAFTGQL